MLPNFAGIFIVFLSLSKQTLNETGDIFIMNQLLKTMIAGLSIGLLVGCQPDNELSLSDVPEKSIGMLQHTVYFYLNDDVTSKEREQFKKGIQQLLQIEDIYMADIGIPAETESRDVTDHDFVYSVTSWFETLEHQERYQVHPMHMDFIDKYSHLWANVRVYDSEIISTQ